MSGHRALLLVSSVVVVAAATACYAGQKIEDDDSRGPDVTQTTSPTDPAGGDDDDTTADAGSGVCTSGAHWTRGTHGDKLMEPGMTCVSCHTATIADAGPPPTDGGHLRHVPPPVTFAGTVFLGPHDEDTCDGTSDTSTQVILTGADGTTLTLAVNAAGNFYTDDPLTFPVTARIESEAGAKQATTQIMSGDCNSCHTADGTPGRIVAP